MSSDDRIEHDEATVLKSQKNKAIEFLRLHNSAHILILPNAWDVTSARVFEEAGFPAVATSSAAVSTSLGYPDGEKISREEMLQVVARIARTLSVPVSADMEAGYGRSVEEIARTAEGVIRAGAVGLNVEDASREKDEPLFDMEAQVQKIKAIRKVADSMNVPLVINARTDAFRSLEGDRDVKIREAVRRGKAYREAGADCIFVFGMRDSQSISEAVRQLRCPINIIAGEGVPTVPELENLGVARVSLATGPVKATLGLLKRIAKELRETGTYENLTKGSITHEELNRLAVRESNE